MGTPIQMESIKSVQRIQNFNVSDLPRVDEFGSALSFQSTVAPAERLVNMFKQIPISYIEELPDTVANTLKSSSDNVYKLLSEVISFKAGAGDPSTFRETITQQITSCYEPTFREIYPIIGYLATRERDFSALEQQARAAVQSARDRAAEITTELDASRIASEEILIRIRQAAAEQGVSQHAIYFKNESDDHSIESEKWKKATYYVSMIFLVFAISSFFIRKIPYFKPDNMYDSIQLAISKLLIFGILAYLVALMAKNFLSSKHNSIVNKHLQNALLTYKALVDASGNEKSRDIILNHAASCIFSPQDTGYTKSGNANENPNATQIGSLLTKISPSQST